MGLLTDAHNDFMTKQALGGVVKPISVEIKRLNNGFLLTPIFKIGTVATDDDRVVVTFAGKIHIGIRIYRAFNDLIDRDFK